MPACRRCLGLGVVVVHQRDLLLDQPGPVFFQHLKTAIVDVKTLSAPRLSSIALSSADGQATANVRAGRHVGGVRRQHGVPVVLGAYVVGQFAQLHGQLCAVVPKLRVTGFTG